MAFSRGPFAALLGLSLQTLRFGQTASWSEIPIDHEGCEPFLRFPKLLRPGWSIIRFVRFHLGSFFKLALLALGGAVLKEWVTPRETTFRHRFPLRETPDSGHSSMHKNAFTPCSRNGPRLALAARWHSADAVFM
jgi:hypothetical protein